LDDCIAGVRGIAVAARRQGPERPKVSRRPALFLVHNITWRALPEKFGHWNSVWKRFWRLSRSGTFEAFFDALAAMSETAHLAQMFDSTVVRASRQRAQKGAA
jgi:transposase